MPVFINNVDDYLGPSQACVNPLFAAPPKSTHSTNVNVTQDGEKSFSTNSGANNETMLSLGTTPGAVQGRRRIRQRRAPQIIQSDESEFESPRKLGEVVRLASNDTYIRDIQQIPTPTLTNTTTQIIKVKAKATVTLSDCLSCSGCVTSAEAVLMSQHSIDKLREVARCRDQTRKRIVFTISSASLADIYRHLYLESNKSFHSSEFDSNVAGPNTILDNHTPSRHEFLSKISSYLQSEFGAEMVIDGALSQRISLEESAAEFCYRYKHTQQRKSVSCPEQNLHSILPSVALSSTKTRYINKQPEDGDGTMDVDAVTELTTLCHPPGRSMEGCTHFESMPAKNISSPSIHSSFLPMLSSSCPGFVCLVEKTVPLVVPLLSSAKSPMAVAGTLLKSGQWKNQVPSSSHRDVVMTSDETDEEDATSWYHVAIMPCHDKKLEAGRGDFAWERQALLQYGTYMRSINKKIAEVGNISTDNKADDLVNEVDLVLTTGELLEVMNDTVSRLQPTSSLAAQPPSALDGHTDLTVRAVRNLLARTNLSHDLGMLKTVEKCAGYIGNEANDNIELETGVHGSGSYADFIFRYAAQELFGCNLPPNQPLPWMSSCSTLTATNSSVGLVRRRSRRQETSDLREVTLYENSDESYSCYGDENNDSGRSRSRPVLRFATAYGFKNVQLMLQRLSKVDSTKSYDYVEIMACPSGCSNGGGQIGANGHRETPRETKERVRKTVSSVPIVRPSNNHDCGSNASRMCGSESRGISHESFLERECFDESSRQLFHTHFHVVPKLELSTGATAGVALSDTKW